MADKGHQQISANSLRAGPGPVLIPTELVALSEIQKDRRVKIFFEVVEDKYGSLDAKISNG